MSLYSILFLCKFKNVDIYFFLFVLQLYVSIYLLIKSGLYQIIFTFNFSVNFKKYKYIYNVNKFLSLRNKHNGIQQASRQHKFRKHKIKLHTIYSTRPFCLHVSLKRPLYMKLHSLSLSRWSHAILNHFQSHQLPCFFHFDAPNIIKRETICTPRHLHQL